MVAAPAYRWIFLALSVAVALELLLITHLQLLHPEVAALPAAATVDIALFTAASVLYATRVKGLPRPKVWQLLRALVMGGALFALVARLTGVFSVSQSVMRMAGLLELAVLAAAAFTLSRSRRAQWLEELLPEPVASAIAAEARITLAAFRALARKPLADAGAFTFLRTSRSGFLIPTAVLLTLVELPALHALLALVFHAPPLLHAALVGLNAYSLVWLVGDRRLLAESAHRLTPRGLEIELGMRLSGRVPYAKMLSVQRITGASARDAGTLKVTPLDAPNVCLRLREPVELCGLFGIRRRASDLHLFLDDPDGFIAELIRRCER